MAVGTGKTMTFPRQLSKVTNRTGSLHNPGLSAITFCQQNQGQVGSYFLQDHLLLYIKSGKYQVRFRSQEYTVRDNEMIFIPKSTLIEYDKSGTPESGYVLDYMMFFLDEKLLDEFVQFAGLKPIEPVHQHVPVSTLPVTPLTRTYFESLQPYFHHADRIGDGLVKIKLMELLVHLTDADERLLQQILEPGNPGNRSIHAIMEENFTHPVSLGDLAYLSGKSLSTFKREFQATFRTSPLKWIRNRRLEQAEQLVAGTELSITEICYAVGFENITHFSKVFKLRFGVSPSGFRQKARLERMAAIELNEQV